MARKIKRHLIQRIFENLNNSKQGTVSLPAPNIKLGKSNKNNDIVLEYTNNAFKTENGQLDFKSDEFIEDVNYIGNMIQFNINKEKFVENILNEKSILPSFPDTEKIIVEFSSPNIAKPFHLGHLRSTIIGSFISNIHNRMNKNVTRLNYFGDWGTQLGYLFVGLKLENLQNEEIKKDPIQYLYKAYIKANSIKDPNIHREAQKIIAELELGDEKLIQKWDIFKNYTIEEYQQIYRRLDVNFDEYHWESMYKVNNLKDIVEILERNGVLHTDEQGSKIVRMADHYVPIIKRDGAGTYLIRDIAAAIDRKNRFNFDKMIYVTDIGQANHFIDLKYILTEMKYDWASNIEHIKFGKIVGMSSREGTAVFLKDILDEARDRMIEKQKLSPTTKISLDLHNDASDVLAVSCVIINDLKRNKIRNYKFDWDTVLQTEGDTGIKLQYTHCRLVNLKKNSGATLPENIVPKLLADSEFAMQLIIHIAKYEDVVLDAYEKREAFILVNYLFRLCNFISVALKNLQIKNEESELASQRLLLFEKSRAVLKDGMEILGLRPLDKM